ncbi:peptidyl-prolyl cis-trans isomerase, cyclophilin-type domain protein [Verrucomicrobiia bacterium DG1235]|nr:peptidyl-prolyl cis-trans isomerase, cyclophilin-type domain protein [Verrucomicrobiae bacterium DG1235]
MILKPKLSTLLATAALSCLASLASSADIAFSTEEDGIYAVFGTTSGEFAAKLHYEQAPLTVANFVGLAEGTVLLWDATEKQANSVNYYDGISFHRVISDFMIQGGSPNGLGTDGPGYTIPDEMSADLTHSKAGILSMANSGANSGGSQFFITLAPTTWLDGIHTIFGEIVAGQNIVNAIGSATTDANDKPLTPITINTVTIVRVGEEAAKFNPLDYDVPNVLFPSIELELDDTQSIARFPRKTNASYLVRHSTDLTDWTVDESLVPDYDAPATHELDLSSNFGTDGKAFVEVTEITNPVTLNAEGTNLTLNLTGNSEITVSITDTFDGTYTIGENSGTVTGYYWYPLEDRDQLYIGFSGLPAMQIYFSWTTETTGSVFVHVYARGNSPAFNVEGTFEANQRPES